MSLKSSSLNKCTEQGSGFAECQKYAIQSCLKGGGLTYGNELQVLVPSSLVRTSRCAY